MMSSFTQNVLHGLFYLKFTIILPDKHYILKNCFTNEAKNAKLFNVTQGVNIYQSCNLNPDLTSKTMLLTTTSVLKLLK